MALKKNHAKEIQFKGREKNVLPGMAQDVALYSGRGKQRISSYSLLPATHKAS